jgi:diguanylate cyclase (GGDEF)-like protein
MQESIDKIDLEEQPRGSVLGRSMASLERLSRPIILALSLLGIGFVATLDLLTGFELDFGLFYFAAVALATWFAGRTAGVWTSVIACLVQAGIDLASGHMFSSYAIPLWNVVVRFALMLIATMLLAEVHRRLRVEQHLARTDGLTGIMNFRAFSQRLDYSIALARRYSRPLTLAYFDMDNFKTVNDKYGHAEGDRLLRLIGETLLHFTRASDSVARLGGDEFAILLPNTGAPGAQEVLGKLREALSALHVADTAMTCSVGAVTFNQAPADAEEGVRAADGLMYRVKYSGKNAVAFGEYDATSRAVRILPTPVPTPHAAPGT